VAVALLPAYLHIMSVFSQCPFEILWSKVNFQFVKRCKIDKAGWQFDTLTSISQDLYSIILFSIISVCEIFGKCLITDLFGSCRVSDRCECSYRFKHLGITSCNHKSSTSTHWETCDSSKVRFNGEVTFNCLCKILSDVVIHVEVLLPRIGRRVTVMTGPISNSPVLIKLTNVTWACIREYNNNVVSLCMLRVIDLHWDVFMSASKSG